MPKFGGPLISGKYTDLTLQCEGEELKVHRALVCHQSPVLAAAIDGKFKEAQSSVIELPEEDLDTVKRALAFFYDGDYEGVTYEPPALPTEVSKVPKPESVVSQEETQDSDSSSVFSLEDLVLAQDRTEKEEAQLTQRTKDVTAAPRLDIICHIEVFAFADRYDVPELKTKAATKFEAAMKVGKPWEENSFHEIVQKVYQSTPISERTLREIVTSACGGHITKLLSEPNFRLVVRDIDGVGLDFLQEAMTHQEREIQKLKQAQEALMSENQRLWQNSSTASGSSNTFGSRPGGFQFGTTTRAF